MDSGNSGSLQSSSGGDEEYDSRGEPLPAFLNSQFGSLSSNPQHQLSLLPHHHHQPSTLFDPSLNLFHAFSQSPPNPNLKSSLLNLDVVGSSGLRSGPDCTDFTGPSAAAAASISSQSILGTEGSNQGLLPSMQLRSAQDNNGGRCSSPYDQTHLAPRNPKKRTRASRRAPTTVITTDTSNFRAMVQDFTGIPAPPFSGSPYSRRLDLFSTIGSSAMRSGATGHFEPVASLYPLRPSAQKVHHQQSPFLFSSSSSSSSPPSFMNNTMIDAASNIASTTTTTNSNSTPTITLSIPATTSTFNTNSINYQLPSDLGMPKQPQNLLSVQNQMVSFQSLLPPRLPSLNVTGLSARSQPNMPFEELGMSHRGQVNASNLSGVLPSHGNSTERMRLRNDNSWRDGNHDHLRSIDSCKFNYSASSSDFHHEKGLDNVPPRGEGTVDSWICPSE